MTTVNIGVIDWTRLSTLAMRQADQAAIKRAEDVAAEDKWRVSEMVMIADQLIALEDGDPDALPFTESQWRLYRTAIRNWKEGGNSYFPDSTKRPKLG